MLENARLRVEPGVIRTFHARRGRVTKNQIFALENYFSEFELPEGPWDFKELFGDKKVVFEIGCGSGESTVGFAKANPDTIIIAIEVHRPSISHLVETAHKEGLTNIKVAYSDGVQVLRDWVQDKSLTAIFAFFPDPWPKKRHFKRRIIQERFLSEIAAKLKPGGYLHIATDWVPYAEWISEVFSKSSLFSGGVIARPDSRPLTRFEGQGISKDHAVNDFRYLKV